MGKYTITDREFICLHGEMSMYKVTILVNTEADIPDPVESWYPGSMCQIAESHKYKILNNERKWV